MAFLSRTTRTYNVLGLDISIEIAISVMLGYWLETIELINMVARKCHAARSLYAHVSVSSDDTVLVVDQVLARDFATTRY
jgi:hypothetical protein